MSEEKKKRVRFSTEIMFILSVVFSIALSLTYLVKYNDIRGFLQKEQEQKERIEQLERENRELTQNLHSLNTDEGIERVARERLGLIKPEELLIYTLPAKQNKNSNE
ncbi:MAG: hypothetical protein GX221_01495 [Candidatus Riflebacteria bacterium]|nr:hypothetical protein [Candidatus Riflebacteria bacterium]